MFAVGVMKSMRLPLTGGPETAPQEALRLSGGAPRTPAPQETQRKLMRRQAKAADPDGCDLLLSA
jgi:hypothetical protein